MKPILRIVRMPGLPYHPIQDVQEDELERAAREHGAKEVEIVEDDLGDTNVMVETGAFLILDRMGMAHDDYWMRYFKARAGEPA